MPRAGNDDVIRPWLRRKGPEDAWAGGRASDLAIAAAEHQNDRSASARHPGADQRAGWPAMPASRVNLQQTFPSASASATLPEPRWAPVFPAGSVRRALSESPSAREEAVVAEAAEGRRRTGFNSQTGCISFQSFQRS